MEKETLTKYGLNKEVKTMLESTSRTLSDEELAEVEAYQNEIDLCDRLRFLKEQIENALNEQNPYLKEKKISHLATRFGL